jgi:hypothetical protein
MKALDTQIGGDHYKSLNIQPMQYSMANGLNACQHTAIKYITRYASKGGIADLEKAKHCIDLLIDFIREDEEQCANKSADPYPDTALDLDTAGDERIDQIGRNGNDGEHYSGIWHHWTGGECPCDGLSMVEVEYRDGERQTTWAGTFVWCHDGDASDILRYRML